MYKIRDEAIQYRYYWMTPNIIDDTEMSPIAFRLYGHLKRVAGERGACWQSTKTIAQECFMSAGSVSNAKKELEELGLIKITETKNKSGGRDYHEIVILDIWQKNIDKYSTSSSNELASSPNELKNNSLRRRYEEVEHLTASQVEIARNELASIQFIVGDSADKYIGLVAHMQTTYGRDITNEQLNKSYQDWCNSKTESGKAYNPLNFGWVEWAYAKLRTATDSNVVASPDGGYDL